MLLDKIAFATRWVNLVNIQVSIGAGDEKIDFPSNFMDSTKKIIQIQFYQQGSPYVFEPTRMQLCRSKVSSLLKNLAHA